MDFFQYVIGAAHYTKWAVRLDGVARTYSAESTQAKRRSRIDNLPYLGVMRHIEITGYLFWLKVAAIVVAYCLLSWRLGETARVF